MLLCACIKTTLTGFDYLWSASSSDLLFFPIKNLSLSELLGIKVSSSGHCHHHRRCGREVITTRSKLGKARMLLKEMFQCLFRFTKETETTRKTWSHKVVSESISKKLEKQWAVTVFDKRSLHSWKKAKRRNILFQKLATNCFVR